MSSGSRYGRYDRPMGRWYLRRAYLFRYTLRELTAVFVLVFALILLAGLAALVAGPDTWAGFLGLLSHPLMIGLHAVLLLAALYNSMTWFLVAPKAMPPIFVGTRPVPDRVIVLAHLIVFVIVSVLIVGLLAGGAA
ncbi:MAG: fumarate reductase subunit C [Wenzhouxiangella sp.]|nr:fumarate reductase subunit C [Wenzhouxiangella sp.]